MDLDNFQIETTTVWSFPERGNWATHNPNFRGNFAPQIARNLILMYSKEGDTVLDPMVGGGTSLIECKLLNRKGIGVDINPKALEITRKNLDFKNNGSFEPMLRLGDVRNLSFIQNNSIDLIVTHPPYLNIIKYSDSIDGDLSNISSVKLFCDEMEKGIIEFHRVLKEDSYCGFLIGDTRRGRHYVPLSYYVMERFLKNGFVLKEDIIKGQYNCNSTPFWRNQKKDFLLIMHEHLFVFRKPRQDENLNRIRYSTIKQKT